MQLAATFYYLHNFEVLLETLQRRDGDLLVEEELDFIQRFRGLPTAARALLVRMIMRKGPLFRAGRLGYAEIGDVAAAVAPLLELGWVENDPALTLADLFRLFKKSDVVAYLDWPHRAASKAALLVALQPLLEEVQPQGKCCTHLDRVYRLAIGEICGRLVGLFFGNFRQDLSEFVLSDLGVFRYEAAWSLAPSRPFASRRQVEDFLRLRRCRDLLSEDAEPRDIELAMPPVIDCEWLEDRRQKLWFRIARSYERRAEPARALELYSRCSYPEARPRGERLRTLLSGTARRRAARAPSSVPSFELSLDRVADGPSVEYCVRDHLLAAEAQPGGVAPGAGGAWTDAGARTDDRGPTSVHYVENGLINSLFGLLCWPAIFAPIAGAFFHPFQRGPADLTTAGFVARRRREFEQCFAELERGTYRETILRRFTESYGISSPFVAWGLLDMPLLSTALDCVPAAHLGLWFHWMLRDLRTHKTGFPDLVQFWPRSRRYRLIEVKAPGDRVQDNQRACLEYMLAHGMPVSVCWVRWRDLCDRQTTNSPILAGQSALSRPGGLS